MIFNYTPLKCYLPINISQIQTIEMVTDVHASFRKSIVNAKWMDDTTRKAGLQKIDAMLKLVGYGEGATNATAVDELYTDVSSRTKRSMFLWFGIGKIWRVGYQQENVKTIQFQIHSI